MELKKKQIDNLVEKLSIAQGIEDILLEKIKKLKLECLDIENKLTNINDLEKKSKNSMLDLDILTYALDKCCIIEKLDRTSQRKIIDLLIDKIYWYGDGNNKGGKIKIKLQGNLTHKSKALEYTLQELQHNMLQFGTSCMSSV